MANRKGGNPNLHKVGVRFGEGQSRVGNGRKKRIYTILKDQGYSKDDIGAAFGELAFYTLPKLKSVLDDDKMPIIVRIVANQFHDALKDSDWNKVKDILDHVVGKPNQKVELNHGTQDDKMSRIFYRLGNKPLK